MAEVLRASVPDTVNPLDISQPWHRRRGVRWGMAAVLLLGLAAPFFAKRTPKGQTWSKDMAPPVTATAIAAPFIQEVVERGEIESSSNVEVRCQVQGRGSNGTTIIEIVPEGKYVQAGDFLVKLDDSALQADLVQQQIAANTSRALMVEAQSDVETAKLALQEYESGTFLQEEQALQSDEFVAKETLRRAEEYLRYSERLASRGYVTEVQLEADRFAVEKARKELDSVRTKIEVLNRFTKQKALNQLRANVETAEARLASRENSHKLDAEKLTQIEAQLAQCVITAPTSGQVVYATESRGSSGTGEPVIAEGKMVRERQLIVRLPDPKRMQVLARINESRVDRVRSGMQVKVKVDAFPDLELLGTVREVGEYPLPNASVYMTMKEYGTVIEIHEPPAGLRAGMTAQVAIQVHQRERALQVPLQAVIERDDRFFTIVTGDDGTLAAQEITLGLSNDTSVIVEDGLQVGQKVVLAPQNYEQFVSLPAAKEQPTKTLLAKREEAAAQMPGMKAAKPPRDPESKGEPRSDAKPKKEKPIKVAAPGNEKRAMAKP